MSTDKIIVPTQPAYWNENFELTFYQASTLSPSIQPISCAFVLPFDKDHNLLLGKHAKRGWDLPGGKCDKGETPQQTACRETLEEIGLIVDPSSLQLLGYEKIHDPSPQPQNVNFPFPDNYFIIYVVKNVDNTKNYKPRASTAGEFEQMQETRWFNKNELKEHKWFVLRPGVLDVVLKMLE